MSRPAKIDHAKAWRNHLYTFVQEYPEPATLDKAVLDNTIADELSSHVPNYNSLPMSQFQTFHRIINEVTAYVRKHAQELQK